MHGRRRGLPTLAWQVARYAVVGGGATLLHSGLFVLLSGVLGVHPANILAWLICTVLSTIGHRMITFGLPRPDTRRRTSRDLLVGFGTSLVALAATAVALELIGPSSGIGGGLLVFGVLTVVGCLRFLVLRLWFLGRPDGPRSVV